MSAHHHLSPRQFIVRGVSETVGDTTDQMRRDWHESGPGGKVATAAMSALTYPSAVVHGVVSGIGEAVSSRKSKGYDPRYNK